MEENPRKSGIDIIGDVPWGTHFCQFYRTKEDLTDILVPYFKAGLENDEFCVWIISKPLEVEEAKEAMKRVIPDIDVYLEKGQMEIIPYTHGYMKEGIFDPERIVNCWVEKINNLRAGGYHGLRAAGDNRWLEKEDWDDFIDYENKVDDIIDKHHVIALCLYYLDMCNTDEVIDVVSNHQFALIKREGKWKRIESPKRKKTEEELRKSEERLLTVFTQAAAGLVIHTPHIGRQEVNDRFCEITGYSREEALSKGSYQLVHPDDREEVAAEVTRLLKGKATSFVKDLRYVSADNRIIWAHVSVSLLYNYETGAGSKPKLLCIVEDITERKRAEESLKKEHETLEKKVRESIFDLEEAYKLLLENERRLNEAQKMAHIGSWDWNILTNEIYRSDEVYRIFGRPPREFGTAYDQVLSYIHPDDRNYVINAIKAAFKEELYCIDSRIILPNGEERVVHSQGRVFFDKNNVPVRMTGTVQDITERKKTENALALSKERYRSFIHNFIGIAFQADKDLNMEFVKGNVEGITGYNEKELKSGNLWRTLIEKEDLPLFLEKGKEANNSLLPYSWELDYRIRCKDRKIRWVHGIYQKIPGKNGKPDSYQGTIYDITDKKKAEEKIKILANAVESSDDAIITETLGGIITSWNKGAEQIYGYSADEILEKDASILEPDSLRGEIKKLIEKIKQGEKVQRYRTLRLKKDGSIINISLTLSPVFDVSGKVVAISAIVRDVTQIVKAEILLAKTEEARKKEIHHRIKNNLQVISSLLDLQAEKFRDKNVLEAFRESQNRVISMALIHEELYRGEGNDTLDFSAYLKKLAETLFQSYIISRNISLYVDLEENAFFNMDIAIPLGTIVNELVSNSLKHAFTEEKEGKIRIKLCREEKGSEMNKSFFSLTISDNGKGIYESTKLENSESLGLQLVSTLVAQLDGKIELKRVQGTEFRITFNVMEKQ